MEFKLNCSPHLKMHEITKKLFNNKFLSDVQFSVGGKIIYAHSLELMKRSVVFENQLDETCGAKKLIPIADYKYENFLEFLRYLYTDECTINDGNGIELLKLATKYKVIMLESQVIKLLDTAEWSLQLFDHCVVDKYKIACRKSETIFKLNFTQHSKNQKFLTLHPNSINAALQFDTVERGVKEIQIFNALADWLQNYCKQHQISLNEGRQRFYGFITKIRFPLMSNDEIRECVKKYPGLLNESDCMSIGKQILYGSNDVNDLWISKQRSNINFPLELRKFNHDKSFVTTLSVTRDTILHGFWSGIESNRKAIEIKIEAYNIKTKTIEKILFAQPAPKYWTEMAIILGDSIRLRPKVNYMITIKYLEITNKQINVTCRKKQVGLIYKNPIFLIKSIEPSDNIIEMIFKESVPKY